MSRNLNILYHNNYYYYHIVSSYYIVFFLFKSKCGICRMLYDCKVQNSTYLKFNKVRGYSITFGNAICIYDWMKNADTYIHVCKLFDNLSSVLEAVFFAVQFLNWVHRTNKFFYVYLSFILQRSFYRHTGFFFDKDCQIYLIESRIMIAIQM